MIGMSRREPQSGALSEFEQNFADCEQRLKSLTKVKVVTPFIANNQAGRVMTNEVRQTRKMTKTTLLVTPE